MWETVLIGAIGALAVLYLVRRLRADITGECSCGSRDACAEGLERGESPTCARCTGGQMTVGASPERESAAGADQTTGD